MRKLFPSAPLGGGQSWCKRKLLYLPPLRPALEAAFGLANWKTCHSNDKWGKVIRCSPLMWEDLSPPLCRYLEVARAQIPLLLFYFKGEGSSVFIVPSSQILGQRTQRPARPLKATRSMAESLSDSKLGLCLKKSVCQLSQALGQNIRFILERQK